MSALLILLALSAMGLMSLQSAIYDIGTSRYYRVDALASEYTMGGASASLALAIKNPAGFDNYLERHHYQITDADISPYFTRSIGDPTSKLSSVFGPDTYKTSFKTISSAPENIGSVSGFEMGKYCMKKYSLKVTGTVSPCYADNKHKINCKDSYIKTMRGVVLIGPLVCQ